MLLGVSRLSTREFPYLEEYCTVMEPLALGLHFLQGEKTMLHGYFIPTLITIKVKWQRMSGVNEHASEMVDALMKRFGEFFRVARNCHDAFVRLHYVPSQKFFGCSTV